MYNSFTNFNVIYNYFLIRLLLPRLEEVARDESGKIVLKKIAKKKSRINCCLQKYY